MITMMYMISAAIAGTSTAAVVPRRCRPANGETSGLVTDRIICTSGCHGSAWNTASSTRMNTRIAIAIATSTTTCLDEQSEVWPALMPPPTTSVCRSCADDVDDDEREDRREVEAAEGGKDAPKGREDRIDDDAQPVEPPDATG